MCGCNVENRNLKKKKKIQSSNTKSATGLNIIYFFILISNDLFCLTNLIFKLLLFNKCCNALYYDNVIVSVVF